MGGKLMKKAYSYIRFSHERQRFGDSIRRQEERFKDFCKRHKLTPDNSLALRDEGRSAFKGEHLRVGKLGAFLKAAEAGKIDSGSVLVVEDFDRLTRLPLKLATQLIMRLLNAEIVIAIMRLERFYDERALNDLAQFTEIINEIGRSSQESARKSDLLGDRWGKIKKGFKAKTPFTGACPRWLRVVGKAPNRKFEQIPSRVKTIRRIIGMLEDGYSIQLIAQQLNKDHVPTFGRAKHWSYSEVSYLLHNKALYGFYQPMTFRHHHAKPQTDGNAVIHYPAIVTEMKFNEIQRFLAMRKKSNFGRKDYKSVVNLFSGLLYDENGAPLYLQGKGGGYNYLVSSAGMNGLADYTTFPYWAFENAFRLTWCDELPIENLLPSGSKESRNELKETESRLRGVEHREQELAMAFANPEEDINEVKNARTILKEEKTKLIAKRDRLRAEVGDNPQERAEAVRLWFNKIAEMKKKDDIDEARHRMKSLLADAIERIEVKLEAESRHNRSAIAKIFLRGGEKPFIVEMFIYREENETQFDVSVFKQDEDEPMHGILGGGGMTRERYNASVPKPIPMEEDPFFEGIFEKDPTTGKMIRDPKTGEPNLLLNKQKKKRKTK
jgi:Recombinase/Resolvase, N terminal domain